MRSLVMLAALLVLPASIGAAITNPLAGLPPLQKVHHSWPLAVNLTDPDFGEVLHDYARITHAMPLSADLEFTTPSEAHAAARIRAAVGARWTG